MRLILVIAVAGGCNIVAVADSPQIWSLQNNAGQVATVVVSPFTNSGTFTETDDSAGWLVDVGGCEFRLNVGGNITHTGQGDHWTFVSFGGSGCNAQALGTAEGYANGDFPNADRVPDGTLSLTQQDPIGTMTRNGTWTAVRIS
jgi:hypothetical protein